LTIVFQSALARAMELDASAAGLIASSASSGYCSHGQGDRCPHGPCLCFCDCPCAGQCLRRSTPRCRCIQAPLLNNCLAVSAASAHSGALVYCTLDYSGWMLPPPLVSEAIPAVYESNARPAAQAMTPELAALLGKRSAPEEILLHDQPPWKRRLIAEVAAAAAAAAVAKGARACGTTPSVMHDTPMAD